MYGSESITQVANLILDIADIFQSNKLRFLVLMFLIDWLILNIILGPMSKFLVYDDACHLKPFCDSRAAEKRSTRVSIFNRTNFVVDKLHIKGHLGEVCQNTVHPDLYPELEKSNTVVCEQTNFTIVRHKHPLKHMNKERYHFFLYLLFDMFNEVRIEGRFSVSCTWEYSKSLKRKFSDISDDLN